MTRRLLVVAALAAVGAAVVPGLAYGDFKQPGGGVYCALGRAENPTLQCWRAKTGLTLAMTGRGRASYETLRRNRNTYMDSAPPLRVGHTWRFQGTFTCKMAAAGLPCKNRSGHGWFLGRTAGYRIY
jgi:hypothetical protein